MVTGTDRSIRVTVLAFAAVVVSGLFLGCIGSLTPIVFLPTGMLLFIGGVRLLHPGVVDAGEPLSPVAAVGIATLALLVAFVLAGALTYPPTAYDSLTYHLFFPARWLQLHGLTIVPTPFGDDAPAYAPSNGELAFLALMMPLRSDALARAGQVPFYALSGALVYAISRQVGAGAKLAIYAPLLFLLAPASMAQAPTAMVDLIWTSMFLATFYFGLRAAETGNREDIVLAGVSLGLFAGTKFAAVPYLPAFLPLWLSPNLRRRLLWLVPGLAVFAAPWYVRNWVVTGSPIYPASLTVFGHTLARGAYDRAAMLRSVFHEAGWRNAVAAVEHPFGLPLLLVTLGFAGMALLARSRTSRGDRRPLAWVVFGALTLVPLFWFGIPYNAESRFLLPAVGLMCAATPAAFGRSPALDKGLHVIVAALLAGLLGYAIPGPYIWFFLLGVGLLSALLMAANGWRRHRFALGAMVMLALGGGLVVWSARACRPDGCALVSSLGPPRQVLPTWLEAWTWMDGHVRDAHIAYTGNNVPYRLLGPHFTNDVVYVNIDAHPGWRFDDYDRARPASEGPAPTAKPTFGRQAPDVMAWITNLRAQHIDYVFATTLSSNERTYLDHDADEFPIEESWMAARPAMFRLVFENQDVRIYAVG